MGYVALRIACCPNGDMVVSGDHPGVDILDSEGEEIMCLTSTERFQQTGYVNIAVSPLGYILLIDHVDSTKSVWVFGLNYKYICCFDTLTSDNDVKLGCVAVDKEGQVLVGDTERKIITIHTCPDGRVARKIKCEIGYYPSMVVNSKNQILLHFLPSYYSVYSKVAAIDYSGNEVFSFTPKIDEDVTGEMVRPGGIVCDEKDNIYTTMSVYGKKNTGHIHKYSPTGAFLQCIDYGLYNPSDLSFSFDGSLMIANWKSIVKYTRK